MLHATNINAEGDATQGSLGASSISCAIGSVGASSSHVGGAAGIYDSYPPAAVQAAEFHLWSHESAVILKCPVCLTAPLWAHRPEECPQLCMRCTMLPQFGHSETLPCAYAPELTPTYPPIPEEGLPVWAKKARARFRLRMKSHWSTVSPVTAASRPICVCSGDTTSRAESADGQLCLVCHGRRAF
jgi:hypothetical protein